MLLFRPSFIARAIAVLLTACAGLSAQTTWTLVLFNAKIWTGNPAQPEAEAVAVAGNRIAAVGTTEEILRRKPKDVPQLDLDGRRMLPCFNDAHVHFYAGGA